MTIIREKIKNLAAKYHGDTISLRRHLHMHPELSFEEKETGIFVQNTLREYGIEHTAGWANHGVVGHIKCKNPESKIIALRADMDALPIKEANEVEYASKNDGVMHACGHDVHTSSLLGAARILNDLKDDIEGTIKLIFQPGEERMPGGASIMIKEGALQNPSPELMLGQHVHPPIEVGKVGLRPNMCMASADEIYLEVIGKGGHAAVPQECVDTVYMASQIIVALQQVVSRNIDPTVPCVLSFGHIKSLGGATNVIPDEVHIKGTFRTMNEEWRKEAHELIKRIAEHTAAAMGGKCNVKILVGYPCLINEPVLTGRVKENMVSYLGEENVVEVPIRMAAEDFSYYSQKMDTCFYRLGTGNASKGITSPVHTSTFDIDESALEISIGLMAWLAYSELVR